MTVQRFPRMSVGIYKEPEMRIYLLTILIAAALSQVIASPLSDAVNQVDIDATAIGTTTANLSQDVKDLASKYRMTNGGKCALLVLGTGSAGSVPIYFIPGPIPISGLDADIIVGPGITVTGITAGPEATAQGKGVQGAPVPGGERFIIFGINSNNLGAGNVANVSFDLTGASIGNHIVALTNFDAGSAAGMSVPLCVTTGVITK